MIKTGHKTRARGGLGYVEQGRPQGCCIDGRTIG